MDVMKMIEERHSVRKYLDKPIEAAVLEQLETEIQNVNRESGLSISYAPSKDGACGCLALKLVGWRNVPGCIILAGPACPHLAEQCGYWGEHLVLFCQHLGLNTCWAGLLKEKHLNLTRDPGVEYVISIGVGYGADKGKSRKSRSLSDVAKIRNASGLLVDAQAENVPDWFVAGVRSALLAPTAVNQQRFEIILEPDGTVTAQAPAGNFTKVDLGIVAYHFKAASNVEPRLP